MNVVTRSYTVTSDDISLVYLYVTFRVLWVIEQRTRLAYLRRLFLGDFLKRGYLTPGVS